MHKFFMLSRSLTILSVFWFIVSMALAQNSGGLGGGYAIDAAHRYFRVIALVHFVGRGTPDDPIRPEFVPNDRGPKAGPAVLSPSAAAKPGALRPGILGWSMLSTDDKKMANVHLVAADRGAFDALKNDKRADIRVFEIGKRGKSEIEGELKKVKKDFDLDKFQVVVQ